MPTIPELVYAALLYKDGESPENPPSESFVEGVPNGDKWLFSFQRPDDTSGTFTLEVFAFIKADVVAEDGSVNFSRNSVFLSGYKDKLTIDDDSDEIEVDGAIALSFVEPETVNLKIKVPDGCTLTIDDTTHFAVTGASPNFTVKQTGTKISAGAYPVTFTVKKGDEIIHIFTENINVLKGLCTDTWSGLGRGETKDVTNSISKTVYVRGAGGWYDTTSPYNDGETATASDDNLGSFSSPFATIQKAVDAVIARNDGESEYTIKIDGTLTQSTAVSHMATISSIENLNLTIESMSANTNATLDAANNGRIMYTSGKANVKLKNIHITGGNGTGNGGGGIYTYGASVTVELFNVTISNCTASRSGGGVFLNGGTLKMTGGSITGCNAGSTDDWMGGEGIYNGGTISLSSVTISGCSAGAFGGGILTKGSSTENIVKDCTIIDCNVQGTTANNIGGGICVYTGSLTVEGGTISECVAKGSGTGSGGGVFIRSGASAEIKGCTITGCEAMSGGGINNELASTEIEGCTITNCTASHNGGGIYNGVSDDTVITKITNCTISDCKANGTASTSGGGGIYNNSGTLELTDVNITGGNNIDNPDAGYGGGIYNKGSLIVTRGTISKCTSLYSGGGIYNSSGTLKITGGTISNCIAGGNGGGISTSGTTTTAEIKNCNIESCTANNASGGNAGGGGIYCYYQELTLTGGTISNCTSANQGGGISIRARDLPFTIDSVTITDCNAENGGGCYIYAINNQEIKNCIIKSCAATDTGGGICIDSSSYGGKYTAITVSNTEISECVSPSGSGIFLPAAASTSICLKDSTVKNDVVTKTGVASIYLAGSTTITEGVIDFSTCTSTYKSKVYVQDALTQSPVAKIKLGTVYQSGDTILQAAEGYTLTEEDCKRFSIDGDTYDIALSDGEGVLQLKSN